MLSNGSGVYILEQNGYGGSILYLDGTEGSEIGQVYCPGNGAVPSLFAFEELQAVLCQTEYYNDGNVSWIDA